MADIPSRYIIFDTETNEHVITEKPRHVKLTFRLGVAKVVCNPHCPDQVVEYTNLVRADSLFDCIDGLPASKDKVWIFAHNLGFDIRIVGLFDHIASGRYTLLNPIPKKRSTAVDVPFIVLDDPPTIIRCFRPDGQELMFVDSWQWFNSPLAKIGAILGNPKGVIPALDAPDEEWYPYCQQDVDVLDDLMMRCFAWIRKNGYSSFHPTRAGQAKLIYTQKYEKKRIKYHNEPDIQAIERPSYFGGFTECFRVGDISGNVHQIDANSLYPSVMSNRWYPCEVINTSLDDSDNTGIVSRNPHRMIAEVYLNSRKNSYPVRCMEGAVFVRGKVRTVLAGPELKRAVRAGDVDHITNYVEYRMEPLFTDFVRDFYKMRMEAKEQGNEIFDYFYKLVMNSLYGKFGQLTAEWEFTGACDPGTVYSQGFSVNHETGDLEETRILAGSTYRRSTQVDHPKSFVAIASFVTSYAREHMREIRESLPPKSAYYQATDSLYVNDDAFEELGVRGLIDSKTLGRFKHEDSYTSFHIKNIHNLDKGSKKIRGSIKSKAVEVEPDVFQQESWENLLPGIKAGHTSEVNIVSVLKRMYHSYDRQAVDAEGWCTPHRIDNWKTPLEKQAKSWLFRRPVAVADAGNDLDTARQNAPGNFR